MVKIIAVHFHLACNWVKTIKIVSVKSLIFICLMNADTLNVCKSYIPHDVFKASCSKSEKLLGQAEFLTGETGHRSVPVDW